MRSAFGVRPLAFGAPHPSTTSSVRRPKAQGRRSITALVVLVTLALLAAQPLAACTVCWGNPDDPMVRGANNGVWVLLGIVFFVQIGFVALFWSFWKRAKELKKFKDQFRVIEGGAQR